MVATEDFNEILKHDQLLNERKKGHCFAGFSEPIIRFPPTYRYNRGNRTFSEEVWFCFGKCRHVSDLSSTRVKKMRTPSYCDRILYKNVATAVAKCQEYSSTNDITTRLLCFLYSALKKKQTHSLVYSDHSPVYAIFKVVTHLPKNFSLRDEGDALIQLENLQLTLSEDVRSSATAIEFRAPFISNTNLSTSAIPNVR